MSSFMDLESEVFAKKESQNPKDPSFKEPSSKDPASKDKKSKLQEALNKLSSNEEKVHLVIEAMRESLSQKGSPSFKDFWDYSHLCLEIFKGNLNPAARAQFWSEYLELSQEARKLKDILDEQTLFAVEQIDLAIKSLEDDIANYEKLLEQIPAIAFPFSKEFSSKFETYNGIQRELNLLNTFSNRTTSLRKEVLKVDMRIRDKSKLLKRLSQLGDKVFPKRKELVKQISDLFTNDVENFAHKFFKGPKPKGAPNYVLKDEIRKLQAAAKLVNLSVEAFTATRLKLSECWDKVAEEEKELKKEEMQKREELKGNKDKVKARIQEYADKCSSGQLSEEEALSKFEEISRFMKGVELARSDVKGLRDELFAAKELVFAKKQKAEEEKRNQAKALVGQRVEKIEKLKIMISDLVKIGKTIAIEELLQKEKEIYASIDGLELVGSEKIGFEKYLYDLKNLVVDIQDGAFASDDKLSLENKKRRRQELKGRIEEWRKILASSDVDIEKAMMYRQFIDDSKERVEKLEQEIETLEEKIEA